MKACGVIMFKKVLGYTHSPQEKFMKVFGKPANVLERVSTSFQVAEYILVSGKMTYKMVMESRNLLAVKDMKAVGQLVKEMVLV